MSALAFYRAMSMVEYADLCACGALRAKPGGMEGKHLRGCLEHAEAFGRLIQRAIDPAAFHVVRVSFRPGAIVVCYNPTRQDGIGPAYFANEDALQLIESVEPVRVHPGERA